jgi:transcriptional regulator with XRE-family HTH domain
MAIGKRVQECLDELGIKQSELCSRVDGLEAQALSQLIKRDSQRSSFAGQIADALGVNLRWLVDGTGQKWRHKVAERPGPYSGDLSEDEMRMILQMRKLSPDRQREAMRALKNIENSQTLEELARDHPDLLKRA